ncbi:MAG: hypothetical protein JNK72_23470 [Myxococcales bacterium]|nr:hypothetical protein [Myxococcales bacterium]
MVTTHRLGLSLTMALAVGLGCGSEAPPAPPRVDASTTVDVGPRDVLTRPEVPPVDLCAPGPCGQVERCGAPTEDGGLGSGNGLDDDCDGRVDEGCPCRPGELRRCFSGPPDRRGVGRCTDGEARCSELAAWIGNECVGDQLPEPERCNGVDDDCNGRVDEVDSAADGGADGGRCVGALACPSSLAVAPLAPLRIDGRAIDPTARSITWQLSCPEGVSPCPAIDDPRATTLSATLSRPGRYTVEATLERGDGTEGRCRFPVYVQGRGLRVELDWDRKGGQGQSAGADLDLHLSVIDRRRPLTAQWFTQDDCYFQTCKAPGGTVNWNVSPSDTRFAPTPGSGLCENSPSPFGDRWRDANRCWNPRLDVDTITCDPSERDGASAAFCFAENVTLDDPPESVIYRVMVNYYRDYGLCADGDPRNDVTHPVLAIHCGGITRAAVGSVDDGLVNMPCQQNPSLGSSNFSWLAADIRVRTNACGVRDCDVTPLRAQGSFYPACEGLDAERDVCQDGTGRVFVRRTGARPVNVEFSASP